VLTGVVAKSALDHVHRLVTRCQMLRLMRALLAKRFRAHDLLSMLISMQVTTQDIFAPGKTVSLFAVPGAFTPGCSKVRSSPEPNNSRHTDPPAILCERRRCPQGCRKRLFEPLLSELIQGVDEIVCTSVNDAVFVC